MIGICTTCGKMFETTTEDACDPRCLCARCYREQGRGQAERPRTVEQEAATEAKRLYGERASVQRVTGSPGMSGYFQAYLPCEGSGVSNYRSVGKAFHM